MTVACRRAIDFCVLVGWLSLACSARQCPAKTPGFSSERQDAGSSTVTIQNDVDGQVDVVWVNVDGTEARSNTLVTPGDEAMINSHVGHAFRVYASGAEKTLIKEFKVRSRRETVSVQPCGSFKPVAQGGHLRDKEMESLVHDHSAPCHPPGKSSLWSCVRKVPKDEYEKRPRDGIEYGFATKQEAGHRGVGEMWDRGYVSHIKQVPRVANTSGYLKMSFTQKLKDVLMPFWEQHKMGGPKDAVEVHEPIAGGYTNSHVVSLSKLNLDKFRHIQAKVHTELKDYLEWWTGQRLHHTSTFGIRIYHRGSMLIDHVDRADTHIASAVIQVDQDVDEDGGWPLEVIDEQGDCYEVYLQPGELVLYEGGRFRHGRPMRLKGKSFSNIFSHFAPKDWSGPGRSPKYDGHIDAHGWLQEEKPMHLEI